MSLSARLRRFAVPLLLVAGAWGAMQALQSCQSNRVGQAVAAAARPGDIVMLSSQTCPYCDQARAWFEAHGVPFHECVIEHEPACAAAYQALQAPGTPTLVVRGQRQVGFSPQRVAQAFSAG
jgi:glutaredoxin